jgi:hypothetical protein
MLPFGVNIPATVPQGSEFPEGLMNNPVYTYIYKQIYIYIYLLNNMASAKQHGVAAQETVLSKLH